MHRCVLQDSTFLRVFDRRASMKESRYRLPVTPDCLWLHSTACSAIGGGPTLKQPEPLKISTMPLAHDDALYLNADIVDQIWDRFVKQERIISRLKKIVRRQNHLAAGH